MTIYEAMAERHSVRKYTDRPIEAEKILLLQTEIASLREESGLNIELIEQPVHYADLDGMVAVTRAVQYPILADECVFGPDEAKRLIAMGGCDLVNIKLMKCGGIYEALKIQSIAASHGVECMLGCMMEGPVSITAAAHFGAAVGIGCYDLDAPYLCKEYPVESVTRYEGKNIHISTEGTGIGITKILG